MESSVSIPNSNRVLMAIPHRGSMDARFLTVYTDMLLRTLDAGVRVRIHQLWGAPLDRVRNNAVHEFLAGDWTHLFFLDDDVLPSPDALLVLLSRELPIVSGLYSRRDEPHYPIILSTARNVEGKVVGFDFPHRMKPPEKRLVECDVVGAGCLLIQRRVFEKIPEPWFHLTDKVGEDVYFCIHAQHHGFKVYVDTGVDCLHIVTHVSGSEEAKQRFERLYNFKVDRVGDN